MNVMDLFAGLGGWDHAAHQLGFDPLGIEWNADACATREAVGLRTLHADISELDPADFAPCEGLIASPPCQDFSVAGKGAGRDGERGQLVDEVMRWTDALRPRWVACEQVPPVLPIWREFAHRMEGWGYRTWCGLLSSERYGVPQTRERAILMASLDFTPQPPAPTHQEYHHGEPARREVGLFGDLEPWVSMAEALGWGDDLALRQWRGEGMVERHGERPDREAGEPSFAITGADHRTKLVVNTGWVWELQNRRDSERWKAEHGERPNRNVGEPAPTVTAEGHRWPLTRPATTIAGDPRCFSPGEHKKAGSEHAPGRSENAIRLTLPEGLILQGFPPDYPVQGTKTSQWLQVGNAIPPPLAKAILAQLVPAREAAT